MLLSVSIGNEEEVWLDVGSHLCLLGATCTIRAFPIPPPGCATTGDENFFSSWPADGGLCKGGSGVSLTSISVGIHTR